MFYPPLHLQRWGPRPREAQGMLAAARLPASGYRLKDGAPQPATSGDRHVL